MISESKENIKRFRTEIANQSPWMAFVMQILFYISGPLLFFSGIGLSIAIAGYRNLFAYTISGILVVIAFTGGIAVMFSIFKYYYDPRSLKHIRKLNQFGEDAAKIAKNLVGEPCYYHYAPEGTGGAIAANPITSKIAICFGQYIHNHEHKFSEVILNSKDIISATAKQGVLAHYSTSSSSIRDKEHAAQLSYESAQNYIKDTGLFLRTNSLEFPNIVLNMEYESAKSWLLIIEKIESKNLERLEISKFYPFKAK